MLCQNPDLNGRVSTIFNNNCQELTMSGKMAQDKNYITQTVLGKSKTKLHKSIAIPEKQNKRVMLKYNYL